MRIHYFDFAAKGGVHTTFNSSMIEVLKKSFKTDEVIFKSEREHGIIVADKLGEKIILKPIRFLFSRFINHTRLRDFLSSFLVFFQLLFIKKSDVIFIGLAFPYTINLIYIYSNLMHKRVYITLHGEMQHFIEQNHEIYKSRRSVYFRKMKFALSRKSGFVSYIVLGRPIYEAVKFIFNSKSDVIVINHPAKFYDLKYDMKFALPLKIVLIGGCLKRKNGEKVFELARLLENEIGRNLVEFKIIGILGSDLKEADNGLVKYFDNIVDEDTFREEIKKADFSLQLTTDDVCKAIASGTLIDSLYWAKPMLALSSSYFNYFATDFYKDNLVFESIESMSKGVRKIILEFDIEKYKQCVQETIAMREKFSIEYNAALFKRQLRG